MKEVKNRLWCEVCEHGVSSTGMGFEKEVENFVKEHKDCLNQKTGE